MQQIQQIDLLPYSNSTNYEKEWTILYRNKTHANFIINKETHFIVKIKDSSCKKYGIKSHTENRLLLEYARNHSDIGDVYKMEIDKLRYLAESHFRVIREKQSELDCEFLHADAEFAYFEIEFPLKTLRNDLDNLRDEFGCLDADEIWNIYVPVQYEMPQLDQVNTDEEYEEYVIDDLLETSTVCTNITIEENQTEKIERTTSNMNQRLRNLKHDIGELKNDIGEFSEKIKQNNDDFDEKMTCLRQNIKKLKNDIHEFSQNVFKYTHFLEIFKLKIEFMKEKHQ
jgi:chromosome segregation ATPase